MPHLSNLFVAAPEIFMLIAACIALLSDLFSRRHKARNTFIVAQVGLLGAACLTISLYHLPVTYTFFGMFVQDKIGSLLKMGVYFLSAFALLYARTYIRERHIQEGEYYTLSLFSILGMMVLISANNLLILYLGLELLSLPLYAMIALQRDSGVASEAAIKYYIVGGVASAILLYGLSLLFGITHSLELHTIASVILQAPSGQHIVFGLAVAFIIAGLIFKLGGAPFHSWVPDVYHGAPTSVALFIGSAPKIAAVGMLIRLLVEATPTMVVQWQQVLIISALLSMSIGNIVAIAQSNIKRMLAYSSIAHMGYMLLGFLAQTPDGYASSVFYILTYAIMAAGAFAIISVVSKVGFEAESIQDLQGLSSRSPWLAFIMLLLMFSMAGIPPTAGFFAKLGVLTALTSVGLTWLAVVALVFAVIGAYYYLAVVKVMYFEAPLTMNPVNYSRSQQFAISINGFAALALGLFPTVLIDLCRHAF